LLRWLPENVSTYGESVDSLFYLVYVITGVTFLLVAATMVAFLILYRKREGVRAHYTHGNKTLEVVWTIVPCIILVVLTIISVPGWRHIKMYFPEPDVTVRVIGKQFNWRMIYPGPDGSLGTDDDLELANDLHVPVDSNVIVELQSEDVIHSFFLPHLRLKQDTLPGKTIKAWFNATKTGKYEIACAELCGFGHYNMRGFLTVHTKEEYEAWLASAYQPEEQAAAAPAGMAPAGEGGAGAAQATFDARGAR